MSIAWIKKELKYYLKTRKKTSMNQQAQLLNATTKQIKSPQTFQEYGKMMIVTLRK